MSFTRTLTGQKREYLFYREVLVYVEGYTDIPFYNKILRLVDCRIKNAGGKEKCKKLAEEMIKNNLPYVIIIDGDYDILDIKRSMHRRVILLQRYSIENYLFEKMPLENVCKNYAGISKDQPLISHKFDEILINIKDSLFELIILDICNSKLSAGKKILPANIYSILDKRSFISFSDRRILDIINKNKDGINTRLFSSTKAKVKTVLKGKRFADIIPGHFLFGIIRRIFILTVKKAKGKKPNIDNDGLYNLLSNEVWNPPASKEHYKLKRKILKATLEAQKIRKYF